MYIGIIMFLVYLCILLILFGFLGDSRNKVYFYENKWYWYSGLEVFVRDFYLSKVVWLFD